MLFIAFPLVSVVLQSVHTPHEAVLVTVENCGPFGCKQETTIDQDATRALRDAEPLGRFVGLDIYFDRGHLAIAEVREAWVTVIQPVIMSSLISRLQRVTRYHFEFC